MHLYACTTTPIGFAADEVLARDWQVPLVSRCFVNPDLWLPLKIRRDGIYEP